MERTYVESGNVISIGYEEDSSTLEVEFNSGIYRYYGVPSYIYDELIGADSKGSYLHQNIKSSYSYEKV